MPQTTVVPLRVGVLASISCWGVPPPARLLLQSFRRPLCSVKDGAVASVRVAGVLSVAPSVERLALAWPACLSWMRCVGACAGQALSLIHISEPTRPRLI
eukprot:2750192-Rhodomonas_salina.1